MDRYRQMRGLASVVDAGSFAAAADAPGVSKAAAWRCVSQLEQRPGVKPMHRTTHGGFG